MVGVIISDIISEEFIKNKRNSEILTASEKFTIKMWFSLLIFVEQYLKNYTMSTHDVKGKVVLIAGGGKNLGGLLSKDFAAKGARLAIHYNSESSKSESEKTLVEVQALGVEAFLFQGDLTKVENITKLFDEAIAKFGGIDIAINTVGMVLKKPFTETTEEEYDKMFGINSKSAYFFLQ